MNETLPFARPLGGKGAVRKLIRSAEAVGDGVEAEMHKLVERFRYTFREPPTLRLVVQRATGRNYVRLLWRLSKAGWGRQKYVTLFATTNGRYVLSQLSPAVREVIKRFEPKRLELNARMMMATTQFRSCNDYLESLEAMESYRASSRQRARESA